MLRNLHDNTHFLDHNCFLTLFCIASFIVLKRAYGDHKRDIVESGFTLLAELRYQKAMQRAETYLGHAQCNERAVRLGHP